MMKKINTRALVVSGVMSAVGFVLMLLEFSVPLVPDFIKFDFSELPALITSFAFGPIYGVLVCFVKNALHLLVSSTVGIGELSNFLIGAIFTAVAGLLYRLNKSRRGALVGCLIGALTMALFSLPVNYFLVYPFYSAFFMSNEVIIGIYKTILPSVNTLWQCLLVFNVPFNFVKGLADCLICFFVYKRISPLIKGKF